VGRRGVLSFVVGGLFVSVVREVLGRVVGLVWGRGLVFCLLGGGGFVGWSFCVCVWGGCETPEGGGG